MLLPQLPVTAMEHSETGFAYHALKQLRTVDAVDSGARDEVGVAFFDRGGIDQEIGAAVPDIGAVLRIDADALKFERVDDAAVFRALRAAVAAGHGVPGIRAHRGQPAHADSADSDKMQMCHSQTLYL